jgi:hypothetical protein
MGGVAAVRRLNRLIVEPTSTDKTVLSSLYLSIDSGHSKYLPLLRSKWKYGDEWVDIPPGAQDTRVPSAPYRTIGLCIFGVPLFNVKSNKYKVKIHAFGVLPLWKCVRSEDLSRHFLFGFIPVLRIRRRP